MQRPDWVKPAIWGAAGGALAITVFGFSVLGWSTEGSATRMAKERADIAVVSALVPFCVAKAQQDAEKLATFQGESSSYTRNQLVTDSGWANLAGATSPDYSLSRACADKLYGLKAS